MEDGFDKIAELVERHKKVSFAFIVLLYLFPLLSDFAFGHYALGLLLLVSFASVISWYDAVSFKSYDWNWRTVCSSSAWVFYVPVIFAGVASFVFGEKSLTVVFLFILASLMMIPFAVKAGQRHISRQNERASHAIERTLREYGPRVTNDDLAGSSYSAVYDKVERQRDELKSEWGNIPLPVKRKIDLIEAGVSPEAALSEETRSLTDEDIAAMRALRKMSLKDDADLYPF